MAPLLDAARISTEFCGAISTHFCFTYSLGGVALMPRGLHARICHACLVLHNILKMTKIGANCSCKVWLLVTTVFAVEQTYRVSQQKLTPSVFHLRWQHILGWLHWTTLPPEMNFWINIHYLGRSSVLWSTPVSRCSQERVTAYVIVRPQSTMEYTSIASVFHSRQWSD